jgi:hypothetical protein
LIWSAASASLHAAFFWLQNIATKGAKYKGFFLDIEPAPQFIVVFIMAKRKGEL